MSMVIAECEIHPTEEQVLTFNRDLFRRSGNRLFYLLACAVFLILALVLLFSPEPAFRWLSLVALVCAGATVLQMTVFLRHSVRRMIQSSPRMLRPHRVVLTEDALIDVPLVGELPPYTEVNYPYDKLFEVLCTRQFYYFRYNLTASSLVPREALTPEQERLLCERLRHCCGSRFVTLPYGREKDGWPLP